VYLCVCGGEAVSSGAWVTPRCAVGFGRLSPVRSGGTRACVYVCVCMCVCVCVCVGECVCVCVCGRGKEKKNVCV